VFRPWLFPDQPFRQQDRLAPDRPEDLAQRNFDSTKRIRDCAAIFAAATASLLRAVRYGPNVPT
jgi:hypothetical protein